jgi:hypothetical protein
MSRRSNRSADSGGTDPVDAVLDPHAANVLRGAAVTRMLVVVVSAALVPSSISAQTGLSGPIRNEFTQSIFKNCFQVEEAQRKGRDLADLGNFCVCFANQLADRLTRRELKELNAAGPDVASAKLQGRADASSRACGK